MTAGLQIWDANNRLVLDVTNRLARFAGEVTTVRDVAGSLTSPAFSVGKPFAYVQNLAAVGFVDGYNKPARSGPAVTFSGNTMSWDAAVEAHIIYGVW